MVLLTIVTTPARRCNDAQGAAVEHSDRKLSLVANSANKWLQHLHCFQKQSVRSCRERVGRSPMPLSRRFIAARKSRRWGPPREQQPSEGDPEGSHYVVLNYRVRRHRNLVTGAEDQIYGPSRAVLADLEAVSYTHLTLPTIYSV